MVSRTSRKKNKGKERKAKKVEAERTRKRNEWLVWATGLGGIVGRNFITCDHGCGAKHLDDMDHPVISFLDEIYSGGSFSITNLVKASQTINGETVLKNSMYREMLRKIMVRMGANMLLLADGRDDTIRLRALNLAESVSVIEHYFDGMGSIFDAVNNGVVARKIRDLHNESSSVRRDALKFYSKRVSCSCLKKMHQEARKTLTKMGKCYGCEKEFERVALSVCSGCMITQYCSRECQVAHWPKHKSYCYACRRLIVG